jgi:hypothetical protein
MNLVLVETFSMLETETVKPNCYSNPNKLFIPFQFGLFFHFQHQLSR